jgi:hypothetical protein
MPSGVKNPSARHLLNELASFDSVTHLSNTEVIDLSRNLRARVARRRQLLRRQSDGARQVVSELLEGRIAWNPQPEAGCYK